MSQVLEIIVPDEVLIGLQKDAKDLAAEMRIAAAVKWYELGHLSQEKAAEVAGLSRAAFINELQRHGVSAFQETSAEAVGAAALRGRLESFPKAVAESGKLDFT